VPDENKGEDQKQSADTDSKPVDQAVAPSPATDHVRSESAKPTEKEQHPTEYDFRKWSLRFTGALVFIGAAYSFFSYQQWQVMNGQLAMSHLDQRAWVAPSAIEGKPEQDKPFNISITVKNTGRTFALEYKLLAGFESRDLADPSPDFDADLAKLAKDMTGEQANTFGLISPQGVFTSTIKASSDKNLTKDDMLEITSPTRIMFVFGKITYKDIFNCEHWTRFSARCHPDGTYRNFSTYNKADDNRCP